MTIQEAADIVLKDEYTDEPECAVCDGHCCMKFAARYDRTGKPWMCRNAEKDFDLYKSKIWARDGSTYIAGKHINIPATCKHFIDGGCKIYEQRPTACKQYPSRNVVLEGNGHPDCALIARLRKEIKELSGETLDL